MRTLRIYKNKYRETGSYLLKIYSLHPTQVKHKNIKKKNFRVCEQAKS